MLFNPPRFAYPVSAALEMMQRLRFGTVVSIDNNELQFSHLPLLVDVADDKLLRLRGHFARANPHSKALARNPEATVIFNGPNAYVSAQWYTKGNPAAPTWNYVVIHVEGRMKLAATDAETSAIVDDLIRVNESELPTQWRLEDYNPARRAALLPHIIGFEFEVTKLDPKFKLTQHYGDADKRGAAAGLLTRGTDDAREIAELMLSTCSKDGDKPGADITSHLAKS
ncbi:FMN-binding negative transcriptional regulator [Reyranella sp.]|uniref:FMN-binding negative transcriptional regulator n=1 Tax=Reyranella sp. TaxID=1929291 RepID=UPI00378346FF